MQISKTPPSCLIQHRRVQHTFPDRRLLHFQRLLFPCSQTRRMMGALVNVRRGGRSPPLLMVALVACILLFGFNYWVSSSRNVELQVSLICFLTYECEGAYEENVLKKFSILICKHRFRFCF